MTLLHVLETPVAATDVRATDALEWDIARQEARSYLGRLAKRASDFGIEAERRVAEGAIAPHVVALAAELEADLLALSASGEGGGSDAWTLGSTAQKILALARSAVLVVPVGALESAPRVPPRCILVPLDGSVRGECVLPTALRLARHSGAEIVVVHAVPDPIRTEVLSTEEDLALAGQLADRMASRADAYLERIRSRLSTGAVHARAAVCRSADHREGIVALAASERADLVVLAAHGSVCNPRRRFGSVASYVIAHSRAPVLVIQDLPDKTSEAARVESSRPPPRSIDAAVGGA